MFNIKSTVYGNNPNIEIKASKLIIPATFKYNRTKNKDFTERIMMLVETLSVSVFALVMEKPDYLPYTPEGFLPKQYKYLLQKLNLHCQYTGKETNTALVFDEQDGKADEEICNGLNNLKGGIRLTELTTRCSIGTWTSIPGLYQNLTRGSAQKRLVRNTSTVSGGRTVLSALGASTAEGGP